MKRRMMGRKKKDKKMDKGWIDRRMDRQENEYGEKKTKEKDILYY